MITIPPTSCSLRGGCGSLPVAIVFEVDSINVYFEEVSAGGVKPANGQVDTVDLLQGREA